MSNDLIYTLFIKRDYSNKINQLFFKSNYINFFEKKIIFKILNQKMNKIIFSLLVIQFLRVSISFLIKYYYLIIVLIKF